MLPFHFNLKLILFYSLQGNERYEEKQCIVEGYKFCIQVNISIAKSVIIIITA